MINSAPNAPHAFHRERHYHAPVGDGQARSGTFDDVSDRRALRIETVINDIYDLRVLRAGARYLPLPAAVTSESADHLDHQRDIQRERSLLFVSATRAP